MKDLKREVEIDSAGDLLTSTKEQMDGWKLLAVVVWLTYPSW